MYLYIIWIGYIIFDVFLDCVNLNRHRYGDTELTTKTLTLFIKHTGVHMSWCSIQYFM